MDTSTDTLLGTLGITLKNLIIGAISSVVSLRFFDGLTLRDKWLTVIGGWALSVWGAAPLREIFDLPRSAETLLVLLLAFFGIAIGAEFAHLIRSLDWQIVKNFLTRR